jgi:hypothetical protein
MQVVHNAAIALRRHTIKLARGEAVLLRKATLRAGALLVVILIAAFDRLAVDQVGDETRLVGGECRQNTHPQVDSHKQSRVNARLFRLSLVHDLDHVIVTPGHDAHLGDGLSALGGLHECAPSPVTAITRLTSSCFQMAPFS